MGSKGRSGRSKVRSGRSKVRSGRSKVRSTAVLFLMDHSKIRSKVTVTATLSMCRGAMNKVIVQVWFCLYSASMLII